MTFLADEIADLNRIADEALGGIAGKVEWPLAQRRLTDPEVPKLLARTIAEWATLKAWENGLNSVPEEE